jgi:L-aspartate oxidase
VRVQADFVVIGGGIAGLRALVDLAGADVVLLTKAGPAESNTGYAQGGIAAAVGPGDSPALHRDDTLAAGAGLCDEAAVDVLVSDGPRYVRELMAWGAPFDREPGGAPDLAREGAHSVARVLHVRDVTGREMAKTLWRRVERAAGLRIIHDACATELVVAGGVCRGVRFFAADGSRGIVECRAVLLATGGAGQVFQETTNPGIATGDGVAMAWHAGARVADLEFVQFHPTVLSVPGMHRFLLSEALRGEGAHLLNEAGERFMGWYDRAGELAARDVVATAIVREQERTGGRVFLSLAHLDPDHVRARFPNIADVCAAAGLDLARDRLPVSPAAHYMCGGVVTDLDGRTVVPGLFAAGEVACTGVHGANRLASNSLLEGLVFGARAAAAMKEPLRPGAPAGLVTAAEASGRAGTDDEDTEPAAMAGTVPVTPDGRVDVPAVMWRHAGLVRDATGLAAALDALGGPVGGGPAPATLATADACRSGSVHTVAWLVVRAALRRLESRGTHRRSDYPAPDDVHWRVRVADEKRAEGER